MTNIDHTAEVIASAMLAPSFKAPETRPLDAARALAAAGLLAPEQQIIRTRDELAALDPDTLLVTHGLVAALPLEIMWHLDSPPESVLSRDDVLPAVVVATGEQVRAARQALEDPDAVD